jgi:hypothetical protein
MKYLKFFEYFNQSEFPDVFGEKLLRGVRIDKDEYIDDPDKRSVRIGTMENDDYRAFLKNYTKLGLQDPTRSVHFYLNPTQEETGVMGYYGNTYRVLPEKDAKFSFCKELRNGGLGSTWYFVPRCLFEFLKLDPKSDDSTKLNLSDKYNKYFRDTNDLKSLLDLESLYESDHIEFFRLINGYQQWLIDESVVGNLSYQELLDLSKNSNQTLQIWTQSPVLHQRYNPQKSVKDPKSYKSKSLLDKSDFESLGIKRNEIAELYKSDLGQKIKNLQNRLISSPGKYNSLRDEALDLIKKWRL